MEITKNAIGIRTLEPSWRREIETDIHQLIIDWWTGTPRSILKSRPETGHSNDAATSSSNSCKSGSSSSSEDIAVRPEDDLAARLLSLEPRELLASAPADVDPVSVYFQSLR